MDSPNLIETTLSGMSERTYTISPGILYDDLSDYEKSILKRSKEYEKEYQAERNSTLLKKALKAFEILRDIPDMPEEAIILLKEWTYREGDEEV